MEKISDLKTIDAPFSKQIKFQKVEYENGFQFIRMRIKEGKRFTMIDLDANTANDCVEAMTSWLNSLK
jgi:hypothetical protein